MTRPSRQAQQLLAAKNARQVTRRPRTSPRPYVLRGLLFCGICNRRMQGSWNNGQAYYRCTYPTSTPAPTTSTTPASSTSAKPRSSPNWTPGSATHSTPPGCPPRSRPWPPARTTPSRASWSPSKRRSALRPEAGPVPQSARLRSRPGRGRPVDHRDPGPQAGRRRPPPRRHRQHPPGPARMTKEQIAATISTIRDLMRALRTAATEDKAEIYAGLNVQLTYHPEEKIVSTRAEVGQTCTKGSCPRGDSVPARGGTSPKR